jgi:type II secretory pathway component GspD/PulD (secretin)
MKRLQFSIRDLLLVTVIAALAFGWWFDHRKLTADNSNLTTDNGMVRRLHYLQYIDASVTAKKLRTMFAECPELKFDFDARQNAIVTSAPKSQQDEIDSILRNLDAPPQLSELRR